MEVHGAQIHHNPEEDSGTQARRIRKFQGTDRKKKEERRKKKEEGRRKKEEIAVDLVLRAKRQYAAEQGEWTIGHHRDGEAERVAQTIYDHKMIPTQVSWRVRLSSHGSQMRLQKKVLEATEPSRTCR